MKIARVFVSAFLLASATMAWAAGFSKSADGITIALHNTQEGKAKVVRLQVINDKIVRVEASPESQIPQKRKSLVVVDQKAFSDYQVSEDDKQVIITTKSLKASVCKASGAVKFTDLATGKVYLQEPCVGGKQFSKYVSPQTELPANYVPSAPEEIGYGKTKDANILSLEDRSGYSWRAVFNSDNNEAFYGLGQHQGGEMNYKGKNEELFQYNTKVAIPFIISTKNYGILWDSYSYGRWGNPDNLMQLNAAFKLYDKDGKAGSLTGTYVDNDGNKVVRAEDSIYYEHANVIGNLPKGFNLDGSKVVYEGEIEAPINNFYRFVVYYAGYVKVFLDGKEVVKERWNTAWNPNSYKFTYPLFKGQRTKLRIEWIPDGGVSYCGLRVATPQSEEDQDKISIWSEMSKDMTYYFIAGTSMDDVISGYRTLTGKAQVMPKWVMGFWQSRERYKTQEEVESTMEEFRKRQIPVDNIVQDWNYWEDDQWGSFKFDPKRFPNPKAMLDKVHQLHGKFMISTWPKWYCNTDNYKELDAKGWIYQQAVKDSIYDWLGYMGSFYDAYSAGARKMFWRQMNENLYTLGVDSWWMDASEPNVRDCTPIEYRKLLCGPTALGTSDEYFNAYSIVNADAIYNGQREVKPNDRVFLLTRSGFAGLQRYSTATWSGDIGTRWEVMRAQMTAGLNFSMAGVPFWGMDQGGFTVEKRYVAAQQEYDKTGVENEDLKEWRELQTRWNEFGCFIPLYRTHGQWPLREVWNIAPDNHPAYQTIVYYDKLRYRMMPYLYSMAGWVHFNDYTMMRGLAMDFASDENVLNIGDQWMFGPAFMACPVGEYKARTRDVYFPKQCGWYDLYTGKHIAGGQTVTVDAPYEKIPVFVREGAIIPWGPELQWSDEKQADVINLYVYAGADGKFQLYEDENTNYNYEKGKYATIDIAYNDAQKTVTFGARKGSFDGMLQKRTFNVVLIKADAPQELNLENPKGKKVNYSGKAVTVKLK